MVMEWLCVVCVHIFQGQELCLESHLEVTGGDLQLREAGPAIGQHR